MSALRSVVLLLALVLSCLASISTPMIYDDDGVDSGRLMYLLKRRDSEIGRKPSQFEVSVNPPFELPSSMIQSMLKYRRY